MKTQNWTFYKLKTGEKIKIDIKDLKKVESLSWRVLRKKNSNRPSVVATQSTPKGPRQITLGKFLLNPPKGKMVYPRRGDLDYRRDNLVVCTMAERQQMLPKRKQQKSSSKYKGVFWDSTRKKWRVDIYVDGKCNFIGLYSGEDSAALAYNKAAREHFGEMAYQNQVKARTPQRNSDQ
ncbi:MAG: hypothetical protein H6625_03310 [Bdellovibrionaceae bacterium]|nr:hypothetical protein [Pseudobdellovibrionaceae bacterium]